MEKKSFRQEQLPDFIARLKSMVALNYEIMIQPIENSISVDKYYNIVKGRRSAAEQSIKGLRKIDSCYKEIDAIPEDELSSYYRENIAILIDHLKQTYFLNLAIIDIELAPDQQVKQELLNVSGELKEMFGDKLTTSILKAVSRDEVTEDKMHNVVKSREMAYEDCDWIMTVIAQLSSELDTKEGDVIKKSWAKRAADENK